MARKRRSHRGSVLLDQAYLELRNADEQQREELRLRWSRMSRSRASMHSPAVRAGETIFAIRYDEDGRPLFSGNRGDTRVYDAYSILGDIGVDDAYRNGAFGAVPASSEAIVGLPETTVGDTREEERAVCLEDNFKEGDKLRKMPCPDSHGFHESCVFDWLRVSRLCQLCRFTLPAEGETGEEEAGASDQREGHSTPSV